MWVYSLSISQSMGWKRLRPGLLIFVALVQEDEGDEKSRWTPWNEACVVRGGKWWEWRGWLWSGRGRVKWKLDAGNNQPSFANVIGLTEWLLPSPVVSCHSVRALVLPKGSALTEVTASSTGLLVGESAEIRSWIIIDRLPVGRGWEPDITSCISAVRQDDYWILMTSHESADWSCVCRS